MIAESVAVRALGAVRLLDAESGDRISNRSIQLAAPLITVTRTGLGDYAVTAAPGLAAFAASSDPPVMPAAVNFTFTATDSSRWYLARRFTLALPRDPLLANAASGTSVFTPAAFVMYPSVLAAASPGSAAVYASVSDNTGLALAGALLRVVDPSNGSVLARGLSDARGEALLLVSGIRWNAGSSAFPTSSTQVEITAYFDAVAGRQVAYIPDPDDLETRLGDLAPSAATSETLASGQQVTVPIVITVP